jgi:hypothetical protein
MMPRPDPEHTGKVCYPPEFWLLGEPPGRPDPLRRDPLADWIDRNPRAGLLLLMALQFLLGGITAACIVLAVTQ